ncbi:hypothetical protein CHCC14814_0354 [Bacillus paralicheniformis]|nr:hypothetical protein CHCC14814_0354 [Bacillus paralicheniformis]
MTFLLERMSWNAESVFLSLNQHQQLEQHLLGCSFLVHSCRRGMSPEYGIISTFRALFRKLRESALEGA